MNGLLCKKLLSCSYHWERKLKHLVDIYELEQVKSNIVLFLATMFLSSSKYPSIMAAAPVHAMLLESIQGALRSYEGAFLNHRLKP